MLKIQILVDNPNSWIVSYTKELLNQLTQMGHQTTLIHSHDDVETGDILCLLGCEKIFKKLELNTHNLVVHESDLPKGKGWSPLTWQILEGKNTIPVTLIEASEKVDAGVIYDKEFMLLDGTELIDEIKHKQGKITNNLILNFVQKFPDNIGVEQVGASSFYEKRTPKDSELSLDENIANQINLLRVCDNDRYPAFFVYEGKKFTIKIFKDE